MRNISRSSNNSRQHRGTGATYSYTEKDGKVIVSAAHGTRTRPIGVYNIAAQSWGDLIHGATMPQDMRAHIEHVYKTPLMA
ncbi:hypothetical protein IJ118_01095 [Candidatus Saccharibacteria bacterium]|nr:hypothetical protein [Candidatus Saccharibacteria bacterium]